MSIGAWLCIHISWNGPNALACPVFPIAKGLTSGAIAEGRTVNIGNVADG